MKHGETNTIKKTKLPEVNKGFDFEVMQTPGKGLQGRFLIPPFSILNAREGGWQRRKRQWLVLGIESEVGRNAKAYSCNDGQQNKYNYLPSIDSGTSIFDPVLCELMYAWFCPNKGVIIDPFAGGSVRGIVAAYMGYQYWGCELRPEQVEANRQQAEKIVPNMQPTWECGDAHYKLREAPKADFIFSCPPYGNLEVYSDLKGDISNLNDYDEFLDAYSKILKRTCFRLKENRFACFVVGNFRDKKGFYHDFVGDTIHSFESFNLHFYNDIILVTAIGSLPVRVGKQFTAGRKIGKTHQNILVFYKGDPKMIKNLFKTKANK